MIKLCELFAFNSDDALIVPVFRCFDRELK